MNPWSALLNGGMLAQGNGGGNDVTGTGTVINVQDAGDRSKMALRLSLLDLGSSRVRE